MAISSQVFPPRKRRPSAGSFLSPKLSDIKLVQSLLHVSQEISSQIPLQILLKQNSLSIRRKSKLLAVLFEEILRNSISVFSPSSVLCFQEMYIVLQRIRTLIEDCLSGSKMWLLMQHEWVANSFHELKIELSTLLDIFPVKELYLNEDVEELVVLIRKQCYELRPYVDPIDCELKRELISLLDQINLEIVPDQAKLLPIFQSLGLRDSSSCKDEIECLEDELGNQTDEKSTSDLLSLIGLIRYAKCVLFEEAMPCQDGRMKNLAVEWSIPADFRCPISLDLMRDPVVVATGQTYDRGFIKPWIESGKNTCPKTGQTLAHTNLIPNRALKNLIAMWCREQRIPFENGESNDKIKNVWTNKTALEATRMTASFLVKKLSISQSMDAANGVVYELRLLAKTDSDNRSCIGEAGAIPLLVRYLNSEHPDLQINAVTTILNLSILEANKARIMETDGAVNGVIKVLVSGYTSEAKGNAAATIFSLSGVHSYRRRFGKKARVIDGLIDLARSGSGTARKDALAAILNVAGDRETVERFVEGGVVKMVAGLMGELQEEAVEILEAVLKRGGVVAIAAAYNVIRKLVGLLREGSERTRESAAASLVMICRKGGGEMVAELAGVSGIERVIWELMNTGSVRGRRKAATLLRILRRWAAGLDEPH